MEIQEFIKLRDENTIEYNRQLLTNSWDIKKFHGFDARAGTVGRWELCRKPHDILGSVILGFLPILKTKTGYDAMKLVGTEFIGVELKSSYTDEFKFIKTKRNAIYSATLDKIYNGQIDKNNTTSFRSNFNATYSIIDNLGMKNIDTYLIIVDSRTDDLVDCFLINGPIMEIYLNGRKIPASGSVQIKLSTFEKLGKQYTDTITPIIGLEKWKKSLLPTLPLVQVTSKKSQTKKISSPKKHSSPKTKIHPNVQIPILCNLEIDQLQSSDFVDTQPISLFEISLSELNLDLPDLQHPSVVESNRQVS